MKRTQKDAQQRALRKEPQTEREALLYLEYAAGYALHALQIIPEEQRFRVADEAIALLGLELRNTNRVLRTNRKKPKGPQ